MITERQLYKATISTYSNTRLLLNEWSKNGTQDSREKNNRVFENHAYLILFAAAYGYKLLDGAIPSKPESASTPGDAIPLEIIWKYPSLKAQACTIVMAATSNLEIFSSEGGPEQATSLISLYAEHGATILKEFLTPSPQEALFELGERLLTKK